MTLTTHSFKQQLIFTLPLLIISVLCVIALFAANEATKDDIKRNKQKAMLAIIGDVIPLTYDNDLYSDKIDLAVPPSINDTTNITVYRARLDNQPVAIGLMPVTAKGYNGNISMVLGISHAGALTGIKILQHNETQGFGGKAHQDHSNWLLQFAGMRVDAPATQWTIKKEGGELDQLSGATITSNSIVDTVYKTLAYYAAHREAFYAR